MYFYLTFALLLGYGFAQQTTNCTGLCNMGLCPAGYTCTNNNECCLVGQGLNMCTNSAQCQDATKDCVNGFCTCKAGFFQTSTGFFQTGVDSKCQKMPNLGERCDGTMFCMAEYSNCSEGVCKCMEGFKQTAGKCTRQRLAVGATCVSDIECTDAYSYCKLTNNKKQCACLQGCAKTKTGCTCSGFKCPYGNVQKKSNKEVQCKVPDMFSINGFTGNQNGNSQAPNSCDSGFYCEAQATLDPSTAATSNSSDGFCCPELAINCKFGAALESAGEYCQRCPYYTHYCQYNRFASKGACCPRACKMDDVSIDGKCLQRVKLGEACVHDLQCQLSNSNCTTSKTNAKSKVCSCGSGSVETHGFCTRPYCINYQSNPLFTPEGTIQNCGQNSVCPNGFNCQETFNICCSQVNNNATNNCIGACGMQSMTNAGMCPTGFTCQAVAVNNVQQQMCCSSF